MSVANSLTKELIESRYENMYILGLEGKLPRSLEKFDELFTDRSQDFYFAPVSNKHGAEFLPAFYFYPWIDISIRRYSTSDAFIMAFSLSKEKSRSVIEDIVNRGLFLPGESDWPFYELIENELRPIEINFYEKCLVHSKSKKLDFEKVSGAFRFSTFLNEYCGIPVEESERMGARKYGLPEDFSSTKV